jgi:hypothetical protein
MHVQASLSRFPLCSNRSNQSDNIPQHIREVASFLSLMILMVIELWVESQENAIITLAKNQMWFGAPTKVKLGAANTPPTFCANSRTGLRLDNSDHFV